MPRHNGNGQKGKGFGNDGNHGKSRNGMGHRYGKGNGKCSNPSNVSKKELEKEREEQE